MSSSKNNNTYKKTSFLAGSNSEFINEFYSDYLSDPKSLPESWRLFFDALSDDQKIIDESLKGPSWSPKKKIERISLKKIFKEETSFELNSNDIKQATKDSVRSIMLIRAYRIRGHLTANLDPLLLQKKKNILN